MIKLCKNKNLLLDVIDNIDGSVYLKETILMYLNAYGVEFDFVQFFLKTDDINTNKSVILRYNTFIYLLSDYEYIDAEMRDWLYSHRDYTLYSDVSNVSANYEVCYEMNKPGKDYDVTSCGCLISDSQKIKQISALINKYENKSVQTEFFLDVSHLVRHNVLKVFAYLENGAVVSVVGVSQNSRHSVISFMFTDEYFRGNGFGNRLLTDVCTDNRDYFLLSSENNLQFYYKCGFIKNRKCYKYSL